MNLLPVTNDELFDDLSPLSHRGVKRPLIALEQGQSSFRVPAVEERNKAKDGIQRDDMRPYTDPNERLEARMQQEWLNEEIIREEILEQHPDYRFMELVAGYSSVTVEKMFVRSSVEAAQRQELYKRTAQQQAAKNASLTLAQLNTQEARLRASIRATEREVIEAENALQDSRLYRNKYRDLIEHISNPSNYDAIRSDMIQRRMYEIYLFLTGKEIKFPWNGEYNGSIPTHTTLVGLVIDAVDEINRQNSEKGNDSDPITDNLRAAAIESAETPIGWKDMLITIITHLAIYWINPREYATLSKGAKDVAFKQWIHDMESLNPLEIVRLPDDFHVSIKQILLYLVDNRLIALDRTVVQNDIADNPSALSYLIRVGGFSFDPLVSHTERLPLDLYLTPEATQLLRMFSEDMNRASASSYTDAMQQEEITMLRPTSRQQVLTDRIGSLLDCYVYSLLKKLHEKQRQLQREQRNLQDIVTRLSTMQAGSVHIASIDYAYSHSSDWLSMPRHSGFIKLVPIAVAAIGDAYRALKTHVQPRHKYSNVPVEVFQRDPAVQNDFALLVANRIARSALRSPHQWYPTRQLKDIKREYIDLIARFTSVYEPVSDVDELGNQVWRFHCRGDGGGGSSFNPTTMFGDTLYA